MHAQSAQPADMGHPPADTPLWLRLGEVAVELGLHPELLLTAIEAKQLPLRVTQFGNKGLWHVNAADMRAYRVWLAAGGGR